MRTNVIIANMDPELDPNLEGSNNFREADKNIAMASGASNADQRKSADVGWESNLKGNGVINEAGTTEEKTYSNVPNAK